MLIRFKIFFFFFIHGYCLPRFSHHSAHFVVLPYQVLLNTTAKLFSSSCCLDDARDERRLFYPLLVPEDLKQR